MDKNTYGHYGWIVVVVIIICILISGMPGLIALFKVNIEGAVTDFGDAMDKAWDTPADDRFEPDPDPDHEKPEHGDTVEIGDYYYLYYSGDVSTYLLETSMPAGWYVFALTQDKTSYGKMCSEIYGIPVVGMHGTFGGCTLMEESPVIPKSVKYMTYTYEDCSSLTGAIEIPGGVTCFMDVFVGTTKPITAMLFVSTARIVDLLLPSDFENISYRSATSTFDWEGEDFRKSHEKPSDGDEVVVGDYFYRYNESIARDAMEWVNVKDIARANGAPYKSGWTVMTVDPTQHSHGEICSTIYGKPVVNLEHTYAACFSLSSIPSLPESITTIGICAFAYCDFTEITIPDQITLIDDYAFQCCSSLKVVNIPSSVEYIADTAFSVCNNITTINFEGSAAPEGFKAIDGVTINYNVAM